MRSTVKDTKKRSNLVETFPEMNEWKERRRVPISQAITNFLLRRSLSWQVLGFSGSKTQFAGMTCRKECVELALLAFNCANERRLAVFWSPQNARDGSCRIWNWIGGIVRMSRTSIQSKYTVVWHRRRIPHGASVRRRDGRGSRPAISVSSSCDIRRGR
jgi:hypothetical protein